MITATRCGDSVRVTGLLTLDGVLDALIAASGDSDARDLLSRAYVTDRSIESEGDSRLLGAIAQSVRSELAEVLDKETPGASPVWLTAWSARVLRDALTAALDGAASTAGTRSAA